MENSNATAEVINEEFMSKFVSQVSDLFDKKSEQMLTSFNVSLEQAEDRFGVYQDQINTLNLTVNTLNTTVNTMNTNMVNGFKSQQVQIDNIIEEVASVKEDVTFIKGYLTTNLDPRVSVLEEVTLKN